jgi:hypothetical protein
MIRGYSLPSPNSSDGNYGDHCYGDGCNNYGASPVEVPYWGMSGIASTVPALSGYYSADPELPPKKKMSFAPVGGSIIGYVIASQVLKQKGGLALLGGIVGYFLAQRMASGQGALGETYVNLGSFGAAARGAVREPTDPPLTTKNRTGSTSASSGSTAPASGSTAEPFIEIGYVPAPQMDVIVTGKKKSGGGRQQVMLSTRNRTALRGEFSPTATRASGIDTSGWKAPMRQMDSGSGGGGSTSGGSSGSTSGGSSGSTSGGSSGGGSSGGGGGGISTTNTDPGTTPAGGDTTPTGGNTSTTQGDTTSIAPSIDPTTGQPVSEPEPAKTGISPAILAGLGWVALKALAVF